MNRTAYLILAFLGVSAVAWTVSDYFDLFDTSADRVNMYRGFTASLIEDIFFFAVLGIAILIYQARNPASDDLSKRVRSLYSGARLNSHALGFLVDELKRLSGHAKNVRTEIEILQHDRTRNAFRVSMERSYDIINLLRDQAYEDDVDIVLYPDEFKDPPEEMGALVTVFTDIEGVQRVYNLEEELPINGKALETKVRLHIPEDRSAVYTIKYWMWINRECPYITKSVKFMENSTIHIRNQCSQTVSIYLGNVSEDEVELGHGESKIIYEGSNILPGKEFFRLGWQKPVEE